MFSMIEIYFIANYVKNAGDYWNVIFFQSELKAKNQELRMWNRKNGRLERAGGRKMAKSKQSKTGKVLTFVEKSVKAGATMKLLKKRPGTGRAMTFVEKVGKAGVLKKNRRPVLAFVEKSIERKTFKTAEESMEESGMAGDSGEMGGTSEEEGEKQVILQFVAFS